MALIIFLFGALASFGLAVWSATQGRLPIVETAHALMFAVLGLMLATRPDETAPGRACNECGYGFEDGIDFCIHCGSYPRIRQRGPTPA